MTARTLQPEVVIQPGKPETFTSLEVR